MKLLWANMRLPTLQTNNENFFEKPFSPHVRLQEKGMKKARTLSKRLAK